MTIGINWNIHHNQVALQRHVQSDDSRTMSEQHEVAVNVGYAVANQNYCVKNP